MIRTVFRTACVALTIALAAPSAAFAHFPFLSVTDGDAPTLRLVFGESADDDEPRYLGILQKGTVTRHTPDGKTEAVELTADGGALTSDVSADPAGTVYALSLPFGVMDRGGEAFLLDYCAVARKDGGVDRQAALNTVPLAIVAGPGKTLHVTAAGVPVAGNEVNVLAYAAEDYTTDADGRITLSDDALENVDLISVR
ncbi:MAG: hypothetical protein AAF907_05450, partial [Planctomycetota bacterium]